jgi:hypothetical protein
VLKNKCWWIFLLIHCRWVKIQIQGYAVAKNGNQKICLVWLSLLEMGNETRFMSPKCSPWQLGSWYRYVVYEEKCKHAQAASAIYFPRSHYSLVCTNLCTPLISNLSEPITEPLVKQFYLIFCWISSVILKDPAHRQHTRRFLTFLTASRPVRFVAAGASLAERRLRVLLMNQSTDGLQSSEWSS